MKSIKSTAKAFKLAFLSGLLFAFIPCGYAEHKPESINVSGDTISYEQGGRAIKAVNNVKITYGNIVLECDEAEVDIEKNIGRGAGDVTITSPDGVVHAASFEYNFKEKKGKMSDSSFEFYPFYGNADAVSQKGPSLYGVDSCELTTCDPKDINVLDYKLVAKSVEIYPNEKIIARSVKFKIGKLTLFYLPYLYQPIGERKVKVKFVPGHSQDWGNYLLSAWRFTINDYITGKLNIDARQRRGYGIGPDIYYDDPDIGVGSLRIYHMEDEGYEKSNTGSEERYKIQWVNKSKFDDGSLLVAEVHKFSDEDFLKDFFYLDEYVSDLSPSSYVYYNRSTNDMSLTFLAQKRLNKFYDETEYLPSINVELFKKPVLGSRIYFDGEASFANLSKKTAYSNNGIDTLRFDNLFKLSMPASWGIFSIMPHIGTRQTYYSRVIDDNSGRWRGVFWAGGEVSTDFYRIYDNSIGFTKAEKFRHIVTPRIVYLYQPEPTVSSSKLGQFDDTDSINREHYFVVAFDNLVQAKKGEEVWDLLRCDFSNKYELRKDGGLWVSSDIDAEARLLNWLSWDNYATYQWTADDWSYYETNLWADLAYGIRLGAGYLYRKADTNQITTNLSKKFGEDLTLRLYNRYALDTDRVDEQEFSIEKGYHCWNFNVIYTEREGGDRALWFVMTAKAYPDIGMRIHRTVVDQRAQE